MKPERCIFCGKAGLTRDEIGINKKLIAEDAEEYQCLECLAGFLDVTEQDILDKIQEFKDDGCHYFD